MKVVIVGGGPAGIMAAISAAGHGNKVIILEKMNSLGKKFLITGKGRCNITNDADISEFIKNIPGNGKFLYSSFNNYSNRDMIEFLRDNGVQTKVERGKRVFPVTDKAIDVLNVLIKRLNELKVEIKFSTQVTKIITKVKGGQKVVTGVELKDGSNIDADKVILATGGMSYPMTGSTGDGYELAKEAGHTITDVKPSLVGLKVLNRDLWIAKGAQGLSLKNVGIKLADKGTLIFEDFGEMLFTHFGVSGPIILTASSYLLRYKDYEDKLKGNDIKLHIDLKPALEPEKLDLRIRRDYEEYKNKQYKNSLDALLPQKLIKPIIELSEINPDKKVNEITKEERARLVKLLKNIELTISELGSIEEAIITAGGVSVKEINPKTMESKLVTGLFLAGEIIDVDALTGGFNLQIAYSTGWTSGLE